MPWPQNNAVREQALSFHITTTDAGMIGYDMELPDMYFTIGKSAKSGTVRGLSDSKSVWSGTQYAAVCRPFLFVGKFDFRVNK